MATKERIYIVEVDTLEARLVRASHPQQAVRHVMEQLIEARYATQEELVELLGQGVKVEDAGEHAPGDGDGNPEQQRLVA